MSEKEISVQEKIILATITCIETEGIHALTTRSIAKQAEVNVAAVNYYFGTKDKLVSLAFDYIASDFIKDTAQIIESSGDDEYIVEQLLTHMLDGCIKYPKLTRAIFYDPFINDSYDGRFVTIMNETVEKLYIRLIKKTLLPDEKETRLLLLQMICSSMFLGIFSGYFSTFSNIDFKDPDARKAFISNTANNFIKSISS